ncbi:MAG: hypothetical protein PVH41_13025 [Anaerolineae bacterium]|jgi:hypothetical protein
MKSRISLPLTMLILSSLACSVCGTAGKAIQLGRDAATVASDAATAVGEGVVATVVAETSGEAEPEPETDEAGADDESMPEVDADAMSDFDTYRVRIVSQWTPEVGDAEGLTMEQAHTRSPAAQQFIIDMGEGGSTEFVQIESEAWFCSEESCTQTEADAEQLAAGFGDSMILDPADITNDADARFVGREPNNGVQTRRYALDLSEAQAAMLAQGDVADLQSNVWIADEPGLPTYTARFEMSWTETRDGETGKSEFFYDVYDVNTSFTIEPPEGAESGGLPDDVPAYPNTEDVFSVEGMTTFNSPDSVESVADFYRDALPAQGWRSETDEELGDMANQVWKKDDRTLNLMVSPSDEGSSVMLSIE